MTVNKKGKGIATIGIILVAILVGVALFLKLRVEPASLNQLTYKEGIYYKIDSQEPFTGMVKSFYKPGEVHFYSIAYDDVYENTENSPKQEQYRGFFSKGKRDGVHKTFYPTGVLREEGLYKDGRRVGAHKTFYKSGKLESEWKFKDGIAVDGIHKVFFENGNTMNEIPFENGEIQGTARTFREDGTLLSEISVIKGSQNGGSRAFYPSGKVQFEAMFKDGIQVGEIKVFDEEGNQLRQ